MVALFNVNNNKTGKGSVYNIKKSSPVTEAEHIIFFVGLVEISQA